MMSYYDKLPNEIQTYIGYFIQYRRKTLPYINEFEEIIIDWYNKTITDTTVYKTYKQLFSVGINNYETQLMMRGFQKYFYEKKYYFKIFCSYVGEFKIIASRDRKSKRRLSNIKI